MIELELPYPPSWNHAYVRTRFGMAMGKKGKQFKEAVRMIALSKSIKPLSGRIAFYVAMYPPDKRRRDIDNVNKILQDSLNGIAWDDDNQIDFLQIRRWNVVKNGLIKIQIREMENGN